MKFVVQFRCSGKVWIDSPYGGETYIEAEEALLRLISKVWSNPMLKKEVRIRDKECGRG